MIYTITIHPSIDCTLTLDRIPKKGELVRCEGLHRESVGGKGINVSRVLSRLGVSSVCLYAAGGEKAEDLKRRLSSENLNTVVFPAVSTRTNYEFVTEKGSFEINETAEADENTVAAIERYVTEHVKENDIVVLSGSLPRGVPENTYERLIGSAKAKSAYVIADTSGISLVQAVQAGADMIKPNEKEMTELLKTLTPMIPLPKLEKRSAAERLLNLSDAMEEFVSVYDLAVLCTFGAAGSCFVNSEASVFSPAFSVRKPKGIKGAGDTFLGTFLFAMAKEKLPVMECLRMASSAAASLVETGVLTEEAELLKKYRKEKDRQP